MVVHTDLFISVKDHIDLVVLVGPGEMWMTGQHIARSPAGPKMYYLLLSGMRHLVVVPSGSL